MSLEVESVGVRSGTTAEWAASGLVLGLGELGIDLTTGTIKVGDGSTAFASLSGEGKETRGKVTLVLGVATVALASVTANTVIQLTAQSLGTVTAPKALAVTARSNGVSFTITSADLTDTSVIGWTAREV